MSIESNKTNIGQLVKDAAGISAYEWVRSEHTDNPNIFKRKSDGLFFASVEAGLPILMRTRREIPTTNLTQFRKIILASTVRDIATLFASADIALLLAHKTDSLLIPLAAALIFKFVSNGAVHYEFIKSKRQDPQASPHKLSN